MPATVSHHLSATTPDDANYEIRPSHWNSGHDITLNISATEISGLFSNANGVSFGLSNNSITASIAAGGAPGSVSAGTTRFALGEAVFSNSNGVSFGLDGATVTASHNALTTAMASNRGSDFVQATAAFAGTSASGTIASGGISVSIGPYITTADLSANSSKYVQNWKLTGNTSGTTSSAQGTDLWLQGGNSITVSGSSNSVVFSVGNYITTAMASNRGTDFVQATAAFAGTSASGTINSTGISVSIGPYITTAMASNRASDFVAATAAFAGTNASGTINSTGISVSVAAPGGAAVATLSYWEHPGGALAGTQTITAGGSSALVFPFVLENYVSASYIRIPATWTLFSTSFNTAAVPWSSSMSAVNTMFAIIYSQGTGANSRSIQYVTSGSAGWTNQISLTGSGATNNWSVTLRITYPKEGFNTNTITSNYASTLSTVNVSVTGLSDMAGLRYLDIPFAASLSPGNYWIAIQRSNTFSGAASVGYVASLIGVSQTNSAIANLGAATASSLQLQPGLGSWSTNTNGTTTSSMGLSGISSMASQVRLSFAMMRQA